MNFYVIGNGFDRHYGLNTAYENFKDYLLKNGYDELVANVDQFFVDHGEFSPVDINTWSSFEDMLETFNNLDSEEIYDEAMANAETDDDRASFWDSPSWNVTYYYEYIEVLKQQFTAWINELDTHIDPDHYFKPQNDDFILSFNYTTTIETNFSQMNLKLLHIHGTIGQELILGHNNYQNPDVFDMIEDEYSNYRDTTTKYAVNELLENVATLYFKNSEEIIQKYKTIFSTIPLYNKVIFMGLSCGKQDALYVHEILKHASVIDFYYYSDDDMVRFESYAKKYPVNVNYISW